MPLDYGIYPLLVDGIIDFLKVGQIIECNSITKTVGMGPGGLGGGLVYDMKEPNGDVLARLLKMPSFVEYVNLRFSQNSASTMTLAPVATLGG